MVDHAAVGERIREIADRLVLPRFRKLVEGDVEEKSPGDLVTVVDVEVERELTAYLRGLGRRYVGGGGRGGGGRRPRGARGRSIGPSGPG
ncbi:MAG: hypothetical protein R2746_16420 [Acidimicrobiales bacterium]